MSEYMRGHQEVEEMRRLGSALQQAQARYTAAELVIDQMHSEQATLTEKESELYSQLSHSEAIKALMKSPIRLAYAQAQARIKELEDSTAPWRLEAAESEAARLKEENDRLRIEVQLLRVVEQTEAARQHFDSNILYD